MKFADHSSQDVHDPWLKGGLPGLLFFCPQSEKCEQCKHSREPVGEKCAQLSPGESQLAVAGVSMEARHLPGF